MRILVVEDDDRFASALGDALVGRGYAVGRAPDGEAALAACAGDGAPDLVLLDLGLPDVDGLELCRRPRAAGRPIIVVTARGELPARVAGLRMGADDYVVKPFALAELLARVEAVLRRTGEAVVRPGAVEAGDVRIDLGARRVTVGGREVALTRKEFDLLAALARAPGQAVERQRLLLDVWQSDYLGLNRTLDVHVATLRHKLDRPAIIETVRWVGYRLARTG